MNLPDDLQPQHIRAMLKTKTFGRQLQVVAVTGSTNSDLLAIDENSATEGLTRVADQQTAGRGRKDRRWSNQPGRDLLFSVLLRPRVNNEALASFVLAAGLAAWECVGMQLGRPIQLKWPNDLLVDGKKICGILCQAILGERPRLIVGIGINVNARSSDFPPEISQTATSIQIVQGHSIDRGALLADLLLALENWYHLWQTERQMIFREWEQKANIAGMTVQVENDSGTRMVAKAIGLNEFGHLLVEYEGNTIAISSGDILIMEA